MCHRGTPLLLRVRPLLSTAVRALTFINIVGGICVAKHSGLPAALPGLYSPGIHAGQHVLQTIRGSILFYCAIGCKAIWMYHKKNVCGGTVSPILNNDLHAGHTQPFLGF